MKIEINLTWSEQKGIEKYLQDMHEIEKPSKKDIHDFVIGMTTGLMHDPAGLISDYINKFEPKETEI